MDWDENGLQIQSQEILKCLGLEPFTQKHGETVGQQTEAIGADEVEGARE